MGVVGGYKPGSDLSRQLIAFSNVYWAKKVASAAGGSQLGGKPVCVLTTEPVTFDQIKSRGPVSRVGAVMSPEARKNGRNGEVVVCINPGGEEKWDKLVAAHSSPNAPFIVLNNAFSTTYGLGNNRGYEEAYFVKRISKGWVYRSFPGPWEAYLEKPDGTVELLKSYKQKPELKDVATLVREESFKVCLLKCRRSRQFESHVTHFDAFLCFSVMLSTMTDGVQDLAKGYRVIGMPESTRMCRSCI